MAEPNEFNAGIIAEFRANQGKVGGVFAGAPLLLLTTTGAKSGRQTTTPLMYAEDGDRLIVFASKAGAPENPAWYHNLLAHPEVKLEVGAESFSAKATPVTGEERDRLYGEQATRVPGFAEYQAKTSRKIPVVALQRASE
ncbi:MAG TPA: nitroreductase family deazaflavin-dependent oxidoreductase [Chloroflexota bacterium]|nr:nitroreductase family deazaflavin-dependent oxidoreductase [Chloroflexota bacterium]